MFAFKPYGYQQDALNALSGAVARRLRRLLLVMATGTGKSVVMALFASEQRCGRILVLAHQTEILDQLAKTFAIGMESHTQGVFNGTQKDMHHVDVLFATFQTMAEWHQAFEPDEFDMVIVDESHHGPAPTYMPVIKHFQPRVLLGATATARREDSGDVLALFGGQPVYSLPLELALARGYLTPPHYYVLSDEITNLDVLKTPVGQLSVALLNRTLFVPKRDEEIIRLISKKCAEADISEPRTLVFTRSILACEHFAALMPGAIAYHSRLSPDERQKALEQFRNGEISTLVTVDMVNEGIDLPEVNVLVFLRGTASRNIFYQQLGRGLRRAPGKTQVLVLDFVSNCQRLEDLEKLKNDIAGFRSDAVPATADTPFIVDTGDIVFDAAFYDILATLERIREGYSDEVLIELLLAKAKELGKSPTTEDVNLDPKMPSTDMYVSRWGSYNRALQTAGLALNSTTGLSDSELLDLLRLKAQRLGLAPSQVDVTKDPSMPSPGLYKKRWGNFGNALKAAGLEPKQKRGTSDEELLELIRQKALQLGRTPTQQEIIADPNMPHPSTYGNRWGTVRKAIEAAKLIPNIKVELSDDKLLELLRQKANQLGRTPTQREINLDLEMLSSTAYGRRWGSFTKALEAADLVPKTKKEYSDDELLELLRQKAQHIGRTPTQIDVRLDPEMPSPLTYSKRWGSFNNAIAAVGLTPNRPGAKRKEQA